MVDATHTFDRLAPDGTLIPAEDLSRVTAANLHGGRRQPLSEFDLFVADCPARTALDVIADTWRVVLLTALQDGPQRHTQLRERVGGISAKVLTQARRRLEANGLVLRRSLATAPHCVEYALSSLGATLDEPVRALAAGAEANTDALLTAREQRALRAGAGSPSRPRAVLDTDGTEYR